MVGVQITRIQPDDVDGLTELVQTETYCPEKVVEDWARLREQMDEDVPVGDLTRTLRHAGAIAIRTYE